MASSGSGAPFNGNRRFVAWPGWRLLRDALFLATAQSLWWLTVYRGADWLTGQHTRRVPVHLDFEQAIPFVPSLIVAYLSLNIVFLPAPFILRSARELRALTVTLAAVTAIAGVGFLLVPAEPAYDPVGDLGIWEGVFAFNRQVALRYNLVPSLHVAMSCVTLSAYCTHDGGGVVRLLLASWGGAIAAATLLTHQHHLLDVVLGLGLAWVGRRFIYERWTEPAPADSECPANLSPAPARPA